MRNAAHKEKTSSSRTIDLGSSYSRRSSVSSAASRSTSSYVLGNAAPALQPEFEPSRNVEKKKWFYKKEETKTEFMPKIDASPVQAVNFVRLFVACVFVFAVVGFVNITLTSISVASATQAETISAQISQAREKGNALEVEYGTLSNPASIKEKATALGMEMPSDVLKINLAADPVLTKDDGTIALCASLKAAANQS